MSVYWTPWYKERQIHKVCTDKVKELKASGKFLNVRVGQSIVIDGRRYSKVFVMKRREVKS